MWQLRQPRHRQRFDMASRQSVIPANRGIAADSVRPPANPSFLRKRQSGQPRRCQGSAAANRQPVIPARAAAHLTAASPKIWCCQPPTCHSRQCGNSANRGGTKDPTPPGKPLFPPMRVPRQLRHRLLIRHCILLPNRHSRESGNPADRGIAGIRRHQPPTRYSRQPRHRLRIRHCILRQPVIPVNAATPPTAAAPRIRRRPPTRHSHESGNPADRGIAKDPTPPANASFPRKRQPRQPRHCQRSDTARQCVIPAKAGTRPTAAAPKIRRRPATCYSRQCGGLTNLRHRLRIRHCILPSTRHSCEGGNPAIRGIAKDLGLPTANLLFPGKREAIRPRRRQRFSNLPPAEIVDGPQLHPVAYAVAQAPQGIFGYAGIGQR